MREVGAFEAKNRLGQLLDQVERGEEIVITRHGKQVARLVPPQQAVNRDRARAAIRRIRERAEKLKLGPFEWTEWKSSRIKAGREPGARQFGDTRVDLCRRDHGRRAADI